MAIADGAETISDLATLRDQPELFGPVASHPTVWCTLAAVDEVVLERIKTARAQARAKAWAAGADPGFYVRLAANWPWTPELVTAFDRVHRIRQLC